MVKYNNVESSLRVLKKKMQRESIFRAVKNKRHYEKPSDKRKRRRDEARRRKHKISRLWIPNYGADSGVANTTNEHIAAVPNIEVGTPTL